MVEFWEQTISLLQPEGHPDPLVKKPKLKPEYLQKPQFKFLVDVVNAVQKKKGFAAGLFTEAQADRNSELYDKTKTDESAVKENKEYYLTAIVNVVGLALEEFIPCNIRGVLKGKDAEGANKFLQSLAKAADVLEMDGAEAVARFNNGERMPGGSEPVRPESRRTSKPSLPLAPSDAAQAEVMQFPDMEPSLPATSSASFPAVPPAQVLHLDDSQGPDDGRASRGGSRKGSRSKDRREEPTASAGQERHSDGANIAPTPDKKERPRREKGEKKSKKESAAVDEPAGVATPLAMEEFPPPLPAAPDAGPPQAPGALPARPMTAKKAPPKPPAKTDTSRRVTDSRQGKARPSGDDVDTARPGSVSGVRVFHEDPQEGDDDDVHIVQEVAPTVRRTGKGKEGQHGALVNDMLQAQQKAERALQQDDQQDEAMMEGIRIERKKKKEPAARADLMQLRDAIESLCQGINPLARSMEYLQEDKDNMQKELQTWRTEAAMWQSRLDEEMRMQDDTASEAAQIAALDDQIAKKTASIKLLKCQVLENEKQLMELINIVSGDPLA